MFYNRAKFQNNLRGSVENTCWIDMEWPLCYNVLVYVRCTVLIKTGYWRLGGESVEGKGGDGGLGGSEVMTDGVWAVLLSEILTRIAQCRVWVVRPDIDHLASYRQRTGHKLSPVCYGWLQYTTTDCCDDHSL